MSINLRNNDVLSSSYVSPIGGRSYEDLKKSFRHALLGRVHAAYLFGSIVTNTSHANDVDIILIKDTTVSFTERGREFFDLYDIACPVDILVYTPKEFTKLRNDQSSSFWKSANETLDQII
jgi:predicted nucleotidyltransferase